MLELTCRPGTPQQKTWLIRRAVTIIGSRPGAHILIRHDEVSKAHAAIVCDGTEPIVCDLVSRNGTHLGGRRIRWAGLHEGDSLRIGPYDIRVHTKPLPGSRGRNFESGQFQAIQPGPELRLIDESGQVALAVREGAATVGSREGADLLVESDTGTPALAILLAWRRGWAVYDLAHDDEPRTQVNGRRVLSAVLRPGDRLAFNRKVFRVELDGAAPPALDASVPANQSQGAARRDAGPTIECPAGSQEVDRPT